MSRLRPSVADELERMDVVWVPEVPTHEMITAGVGWREVDEDERFPPRSDASMVSSVYHVMLQAAQEDASHE